MIFIISYFFKKTKVIKKSFDFVDENLFCSIMYYKERLVLDMLKIYEISQFIIFFKKY